ncbi:MAG: PilN domain-containing protein, partial [Proteobacteria bacterium]|nr:PilN domain-containing protein [Pseudomonadota bacterium]
MIRINLAKSKKAVAAGSSVGATDLGDIAELQKKGALNLLLAFLFPLALYAYDYVTIPELRAQVKKAEKSLADLERQNLEASNAVQEKRKFNEDKAKLETQIRFIEGLSLERMKEVRILDTLQKDLPSKVWLTRLEFRENRLNIFGLATSDADLTSMLEVLSQSVFLKEVRLVRSAEQPSPQGILKT